jgi:hypothetical protein
VSSGASWARSATSTCPKVQVKEASWSMTKRQSAPSPATMARRAAESRRHRALPGAAPRAGDGAGASLRGGGGQHPSRTHPPPGELPCRRPTAASGI